MIPLRLKVFDTLLVLVENAGRLVTKQELLDTVWPETTVEENNLNHNVSVLRKALGEKPRASSTSRPCRAWAIASAPVDAAAAEPAPPLRQPRSRGRKSSAARRATVSARLCHGGSGPPLVKASNWLTHLDFEWGSPIWRHWCRTLSRITGSSATTSVAMACPSATCGCELRHVGSRSRNGRRRGRARSISAARDLSRRSDRDRVRVKHPERVTHLVLYGAFAAGMKHVGTPQELEARRALASLMRLGWGLNNPAFCKTFTCRFIPEATPEHEQWFDELQRVSTSPENAARLMERDDDIDVRPLCRR